MITTASSTIIPVTRTKAKRLRVLREAPVAFMIIKAQRKEKGIPTAVTRAFRKPRSTHSRTVTSTIPRMRLPLRALTLSRISMEESLVQMMLTPSC